MREATCARGTHLSTPAIRMMESCCSLHLLGSSGVGWSMERMYFSRSVPLMRVSRALLKTLRGLRWLCFVHTSLQRVAGVGGC